MDLGMGETKEFKTVMDIAKTICEFIAGEHVSMFRRITGAVFGISTSVVSVRVYEKHLDLENLNERTEALYNALYQKGAKVLTVKVFFDGIKYTHRYGDKGANIEQWPDNLPEGSLFLVEMGKKKDLPLNDSEPFLATVGPVIAPLLDNAAETNLFLNGELFSFTVQ